MNADRLAHGQAHLAFLFGLSRDAASYVCPVAHGDLRRHSSLPEDASNRFARRASFLRGLLTAFPALACNINIVGHKFMGFAVVFDEPVVQRF
ncbi:MAG: hypothetical protein QOI13_1081 [Paraburkholderia sp.]|nr:hypothetical protein [Paraburkholderia sp.]